MRYSKKFLEQNGEKIIILQRNRQKMLWLLIHTELRMTQKEFAKRIGYTEQQVSRLCCGRNMITDNVIRAIERVFPSGKRLWEAKVE